MIDPNYIRILDRNDLKNQVVDYEDGFRLRYFVEDKGDEENKLKEDIVNNVLRLENFPFGYVIHGNRGKLRDKYKSVNFIIPIPHEEKEINGESNLNYIIYSNGVSSPFIVSHYIFPPSRKIWDEKTNVGDRLPLESVIISYILNVYYKILGIDEVNNLLYKLKNIRIINYFNIVGFDKGHNLTIALPNKLSTIRTDLGLDVVNCKIFSILDKEYFKDIDVVINKLMRSSKKI